MCKKLYLLLTIVLLMSQIGGADEYTRWWNDGANQLWSTTANWQYDTLPDDTNTVSIEEPNALNGNGPIIQSGIAADCNILYVAYWDGPITLTMTGGTLDTALYTIIGFTDRVESDADGIIDMSGGTIDTHDWLVIGHYGGVGTVNQTGGTIKSHHVYIGEQGSAGDGTFGYINLDGGTIDCNNFTIEGGRGLVDINNGTLIINGNVTSTINSYISSGYITGYDDTGAVDVDYNVTNAGKTTVTAASLPGKASSPIPTDSATNVGVTTDISWTAGTGATNYNVYFGTNSTPSAGELKGNQPGLTYDTNTMSNSTTYYWRIDSNNTAGVTTGDIWSFTTISGAVEPNIVVWYKFDETSGTTAADSSGYSRDGTRSGAAWNSTGGQVDGALDCNGDGYVSVPSSVFSGIGNEVTICIWQYGNAAIQPSGDMLFNSSDFKINSHVPWGDGIVYWEAPRVGGVPEEISKAANAANYEGAWNHWAFTKDAAAGDMKIYLNGQLWHSGTGKTNSMAGITTFAIGAQSDGSQYKYHGLIDSFRIYDKELSATDINDIYIDEGGTPPSGLTKATSPAPVNIATDIDPNATLSWTPGDDANSHDVYFGTSSAAVSNATTSSDEFMGNQDSNTFATSSYDPNFFMYDDTFYWRIDEVNGANKLIGNLWQFTTRIFPHGLTVKNGTLMLNGSAFRGAGVNYIDPFNRLVADGNDDTYIEKFAMLNQLRIPFARIRIHNFWASDSYLYETDPNEWYYRLDKVIAAAEANDLGLIPSFCWGFWIIPDLEQESCDQWGNGDSNTIANLKQMVQEIVPRYYDSPAIWGWELGNEWTLFADLPGGEGYLGLPVDTNYGTPAFRTPNDNLTHEITQFASQEFAREVRKYDPYRIVETGDAIPRPQAWHNWKYGNWTTDTLAQYEEVLLADTPFPTSVISIHAYEDDKDRIDETQVIAVDNNIPLFVGEFGGMENSPTPEADFWDTLKIIEDNDVPLCAVWVYEFDDQDGIHNITAENSRSYQLSGLQQFNARFYSLASDPVPFCTEKLVDSNADLSWTPDPDANSHDVYFGTAYADVNDANTSSSEFKGNQDSNSYDPGTLNTLTTYYWRIDEVNGPTTRKGYTWWLRTQPNDFDPNCIGWWKFDETFGTTAVDSSGYERGAAVTGAIWDANGQVNGALNFDGNDYVLVSADVLNYLDTKITISLWINGDTNDQPQEDAVFFVDPGKIAVHLPWGDGKVYFETNDANDSISKTADANDYEGQWNHWAFTKDVTAGEMKIYLNGVLWHSGTGLTEPFTPGNQITIGAVRPGEYQYDGLIDDVKLFNRALDANEINDIYESGL